MPEADEVLEWSHGSAVVSPLAGMLTHARFRLGDGWFAPFARAPWLDDQDARADDDDATSALHVPGHVRTLGGDFACVPFGSAALPADRPGPWRELPAADPDVPPHGWGAEVMWTVVARTGASVALAVDYPPSSPVARLERVVQGVDGEPALRFRLVVHARRPVRTAVGVHPVLRLPDAPGALRLSVPFAHGLGYPGTVEGGRTVVLPWSGFAALAEVPTASGPVDLGRLPLRLPRGAPLDDVVQLCGVSGPVTADYLAEGAGVQLDWDRRVLPSLLLWISDRGIDAPPWSGRYRGLGVEPVASAFDLPAAVSAGDNPLTALGHRTCVALTPAAPLVVEHSVRAHLLDPHPSSDTLGRPA